MNRKKTIVFATATYSLAETQRMVQIASEVKKGGIFNVIVTHYTPLDAPYSFAKIIKEEGLDDALLTPLMTKELAEYIYAVDRGEKTGAFIPYNILKERVNSEIDFLKSNDVACVVTGFCLSFFVSARILDIPVVSVLSGSMFWWLQQDSHLARIPDMMSTGPMKLIPQKWAFSMINWIMNKVPLGLQGMNKILKLHQKKTFRGVIDFLKGDIFFASDIPEFIPVSEDIENLYYIGSLIGRLKADVPEEIRAAQKYAEKKQWPLVYFAMGSSGRPVFIRKCLEILSVQNMVIISPMKKMLAKDEITKDYQPTENIFLSDWLPSDKVNPLCDVALIHGGQGTVYTAILSETPFCAIGNGNPEQEFNVEAAVKHGFAKLYRRNKVKPEEIIKGLEELLTDKQAKEKIKKMAALLNRPEWNGEKRAAKKLEELFK